MESRALARYEKLLTDRRTALVKSGPERIEPNRTDTATTGVADEDSQALSEMLQTLASTRNRESAQILAAIDRALRRLHERPDEFGQCEDCEEDIPPRRLEVVPWATLCTECQAKADPKRNIGRKKVTDFR